VLTKTRALNLRLEDSKLYEKDIAPKENIAATYFSHTAINLEKFRHCWTGLCSSISKTHSSKSADEELRFKASNYFPAVNLF